MKEVDSPVMRRTLLALLLALSAAPALAQYVGPAQTVPPPPPMTDETVEEPPAPPGRAPAARQASVPEWSLRRLRIRGMLGATFAYGEGSVSLGAGVGSSSTAGCSRRSPGRSFGSSPTVFMLKPGVDWFLPVPGGVVPYVGGYYAHWLVSGGYLPQDAWGVRAGLSFASVGPVTFLLGIAYERVFTNCTGTCAYWVPQVAAGFAL